MKRVKSMAKYLVLWEMDPARMAGSAKEQGTDWLALTGAVKADMKKGVSTDWGIFTGELRGYAVHEGTEVEIMSTLMQYVPYIKFEVHPVSALAQVELVIRASMK
jgi:hypothetical protein